MPINGFKFKPFQKEGINGIEFHDGRCLLADEMGLGKTPQVYGWLESRKDVKRVLVVCPASLKWHWAKEAKDHFGIKTQVLSSRDYKSQRINTKNVLIINYDILKAWLPKLSKLNLDCVVFDEGQYLINRYAKRTKAARRLSHDIDHVIIPTGTPLVNRPAELFSLLNMLRPDEFPSFFPFAMHFCRPKKVFGRWDFSGAKNLKELNKLLNKTCMIRRRKEDVLDQLPSKMNTVLPVDVKHFDEYQKAEKDFINWLRANDPEKVKGALRAEGFAKIQYLKRLVGRYKIYAIKEWIDNFLKETGDGKLIVFGIHKFVIRLLYDHYSDIAVKVDGSVAVRKREKLFHAFNNRDETRLFIGNIKAAGTGWSASRCSNVLFAELGWTPAEHNQASDRIHGIGRGEKNKRSLIWWMVGKDTIEERICRAIQKKQEQSDIVLDGKSSPTRKLDIYSSLCRQLGKVPKK